MTAISSYDDIINRIGGGFWASYPIYDIRKTASVILGGNGANYYRMGQCKSLVTPLPTGVTAYIPTSVCMTDTDVNNSTAFIVAKMINLGSLNIATPTFSDGSAMPTVTELNVSRSIAGAVFMEVTTVLNATPGSITITYTDQDGNSTETTTAQALGASSPVGSAGFIALNSADTGVRDITAATRTGGTTPTGVVKFWGLIPISIIGKPTIRGFNNSDNLITAGFNPVRLGAADVIGVFSMSGGTSTRSALGEIFLVGDQ